MIKEIIENNIQLIEGKVSWQEAISISFGPLLKNGAIKQSYIDHTIAKVEKLGPYICIAPDFAMPHARPEDGVNRLGMSVMLSKKDIKFKNNKTARLFITLASPDNNSHLECIQSLMEMLSNDMQALLDCKSVEEIKIIISKY